MEQENKSLALNKITFQKMSATLCGRLNYFIEIRKRIDFDTSFNIYIFQQHHRYKFCDSKIQTLLS
jgi:hypothetical protein